MSTSAWSTNCQPASARRPRTLWPRMPSGLTSTAGASPESRYGMSDSLADLIGELGNGVHDVADGINEGTAALVHSAAVGMLNSVPPPMVHGKNAVTRASGWIPLEAGTLE